MHEPRGLRVELPRERSQTQITPKHLSRKYISRSRNWTLGLCGILVFGGGSTLLACVLASHNMGADDTPVRAAYPARALVNELQCHGRGDDDILQFS